MNVMLTPAVIDDAERMLAAIEPGASRNLKFFSEPVTVERQREWLGRVLANPREDLRCVLDDGRLVGTVGLHEIDEHLRTARLGLLVFRAEDRGKGYGSGAIRLMLRRAFTVHSLNKVYLNVFAENVRSRTLYAKLGFVQEGVLRQEYLLDGTYHDMVRMSMLRTEWEALSE